MQCTERSPNTGLIHFDAASEATGDATFDLVSINANSEVASLSRPDRGTSYGYLLAAGYAVLLLVSVLVHEAAHALAARWRGHPAIPCG